MPLQSGLPRHSQTSETESLYGYFLRLTDENGFNSPSDVARRAGMRQSETRGARVSGEKLAGVTGHAEVLGRIGYNASTPRQSRVLGHNVPSRDIRPGAVAVCPSCVRECGILQAHFDLELMVACPVHKRILVGGCLKCGSDLSWHRPALLKCACGADLSIQATSPGAMNRDCRLLEIVRAKVLRIELSPESTFKMPDGDLLRLDLQNLLFLIRHIGKAWAINSGYSERQVTPAVLVASAAKAFSEWPNNFHKLLRIISEHNLQNRTSTSVVKQFGSFFLGIFAWNAAAFKPGQQDQFLRDAFMDFLLNEWGQTFVDGKLFGGASVTPRRFVSVARFSEISGIDWRTTRRWVKSGKIQARTIKAGSRTRVLVDLQDAYVGRKDSGYVVGAIKAAKLLGISKDVLRILKLTGVFVVEHLTKNDVGFHEVDLKNFVDRFLQLPVMDARKSVATVSMRKLMQATRLPPESKATIVSKLLAQEIVVAGRRDETIAGIEFPSDDFNSFVDAEQRRIKGDTKSPHETAQILGCSRRAIPGLVQRRLLEANCRRHSMRVGSRSIRRFVERFTSLSTLARKSGLHHLTLRKLCAEHDIATIAIACDHGIRQIFLDNAATMRLAEIWSSRLGLPRDEVASGNVPAPLLQRLPLSKAVAV